MDIGKAFEVAFNRKKEKNWEKMPYISQAGLRVLLMMRESVKDLSCFKLFHVQPEVEKILKVTGFDKLLIR